MEKKTEQSEQNEIVDWPKSMRIYINNDAREETKNILESIITIPVIDIILEYGFSWYINILTNEKILRNVNFNDSYFYDMNHFGLSGTPLWHFISLFCEIFPNERNMVCDESVCEYDEYVKSSYPNDKLNYMINKLQPYILDCPIHSPDINKIVITINNSDLLKRENKIDTESEFVALDNVLGDICLMIESIKNRTGWLFEFDKERYIKVISVGDNSCINNETLYVNYMFTKLD